jgi:hypothetical protein
MGFTMSKVNTVDGDFVELAGLTKSYKGLGLKLKFTRRIKRRWSN